MFFERDILLLKKIAIEGKSLEDAIKEAVKMTECINGEL
jgi:hypothetical protein